MCLAEVRWTKASERPRAQVLHFRGEPTRRPESAIVRRLRLSAAVSRQMQPTPATRSHADVGPRDAIRPPLKWAGGKRWQVPHLRPLWEPYQSHRLVEPFCGGIGVT